MDAQGQPLIQVKESNQVLAIVRRFGGEIPILGALVEIVVMLMKYHFVFIDIATGQQVGEYRKTTLWRDHYELSLDDTVWNKLDWRVYASVGVALDALQSR